MRAPTAIRIAGHLGFADLLGIAACLSVAGCGAAPQSGAGAAPATQGESAASAQAYGEPIPEGTSAAAPGVEAGGQGYGSAAPEAGSAAAGEADDVAAEEPAMSADAAPEPPAPAAAQGPASSTAAAEEKVEPPTPQTPQPATRPPPATPTVKYLSADDSNSTASAVIARRTIQRGRLVQPASVRTYEMLNYYTFTYPAAEPGTVRVIPQMREMGEDEYSLQVAVRAPDRALANLPPLDMTFVLDVSGSMAGEPFGLAKATLLGIAGKLRANDRVAVVICNRTASVLQGPQSADRKTLDALRGRLASLDPSDVTDLEKGIAKAYEIAASLYEPGRLGRVVLLSDGADNARPAAVETIARYAADSERQGIYLAGIGFGQGLNDYLMDTFTDKGRGAYLFIDSADELARALEDRTFVATFDLAAKDIRLKLVLPAGWAVKEFHGEQMSSVASEVVPQYLAPNDQMIYHLSLITSRPRRERGNDVIELEAEYTPLASRGAPALARARATVGDMLHDGAQVQKGDAIVAYAKALEGVALPLDANRDANLERLDAARDQVRAARERVDDRELVQILALLETYRRTIEFGEQLIASRDREETSPDAALGISANALVSVDVEGASPAQAVRSLERLGGSTRLLPQEGYRFLVLSSGPVWNPSPAGGGSLSGGVMPDPRPELMGSTPTVRDARPIYDNHKVRLRLRAPATARSFSFDFNFFSAEYPQYINSNYNDTFYAVLEARSTNGGRSTNIAFDANQQSIEVDNNYFQQPFHPVPNAGTGFDAHGSTGWLRTSWPCAGGEELVLTFSIHDEGDGAYDSLVVLDNFQFSEHPAVGNTNPLN